MLKRNVLLIVGSAMLSALASAEVLTVPVIHSAGAARYRADGVVEAVRDTVVAAQTSGRITAVSVRAGDRVVAGQVLLRIDERVAADQMTASRAQLDAVRSEYERSKELFAKRYISQAALDQSEAQYKLLRAQRDTSTTQASYHTITAPYAGVVTAVAVAVGDMAMPGRSLLQIYDPAELRAVVSVPESIVQSLQLSAPVNVEIPAAAPSARLLVATAAELIPAADAATHAVQVRLSLPASNQLLPGQFVRAELPLRGSSAGALLIPLVAVIHRGEFVGVYILNMQKQFQLRQIRLGHSVGDKVEVLAGATEGELVALDPLAAAKQP